jgi:accessory colonization factor AcfC
MHPLYKQALEQRGVEPNTTWMKSDGSEMYVVMPDDEEEMHSLCEKHDLVYSFNERVEPMYVRVLRIAVGSKHEGANVDVMFAPYLCGQIDQGRLTRIG